MKTEYTGGRKRRKNLIVRVTEQEHERIMEEANKRGFSYSTWIRKVIFEQIEKGI